MWGGCFVVLRIFSETKKLTAPLDSLGVGGPRFPPHPHPNLFAYCQHLSDYMSSTLTPTSVFFFINTRISCEFFIANFAAACLPHLLIIYKLNFWSGGPSYTF